VRDFRRADNLVGRRTDRRDAERHLDRSAVFADARRFVVLDRVTLSYPSKDIPDFSATFRRHDDVDALADGFRRGEAKQAFGGIVPSGDGTIELLGNDGVVGGFDYRAEQAFALGIIIASDSAWRRTVPSRRANWACRATLSTSRTASTKLAAHSP